MSAEDDKWEKFIKDEIERLSPYYEHTFPYMPYFFSRIIEKEPGVPEGTICELRYYRGNNDTEPIIIELEVISVDQHYYENFGLPFYFEYLEPVEKPNGYYPPQIRISAGPGVSIRLPKDYDEWKDKKKSIDLPNISIIRLQDPILLPKELGIVAEKLLVSELFHIGEKISFEEGKKRAIEEWDRATDFTLLQSLKDEDIEPYLPSQSIYIQNLREGVFIYCPITRQGLMVQVPVFDICNTEDGENEDFKNIDAHARFEYKILSNKESNKTINPKALREAKYHDPPKNGNRDIGYTPPLVILAVSSNVSVQKMWFTTKSFFEDETGTAVMEGKTGDFQKSNDVFFRNIQQLGPNPFYVIYIEDNKPFPTKDELYDLFLAGAGSSLFNQNKNFLTRKFVEPGTIILPYSPACDFYEDSFFAFVSPMLAIYTVLCFTPIIGDILDVAEFMYTSVTGKDFLQNKVTLEEYYVQFLAVLPFIPSVPAVARKSQELMNKAKLKNIKDFL